MDIEEDVLAAARELAKTEGRTIGQVLSALARKALTSGSGKGGFRTRVPLLPSRGKIITSQFVRRLMDKEGV